MRTLRGFWCMVLAIHIFLPIVSSARETQSQTLSAQATHRGVFDANGNRATPHARDSAGIDVRFGSLADVMPPTDNVCFAPESRHSIATFDVR
jgi:hypothetical protein